MKLLKVSSVIASTFNNGCKEKALNNSKDILTALNAVLEERKSAPADSSYVASLHEKGLEKILEKVAEESNETIEAAREEDTDHLVYEVADLWFHCMVLLSHKGLSYEQVLTELGRRFGLSGLEEKASRQKK